MRSTAHAGTKQRRNMSEHKDDLPAAFSDAPCVDMQVRVGPLGGRG